MIIKTDNMESVEYPEGETLARCYKVFDLGMQPGVESPQHEVAFVFELDVVHPDGKPLTITKRFTASMHPKSNLRRFIEAWRGSPFNNEEVKEYNTDVLEGAYAYLTIYKKVSEKTNKAWSDIFQIRKKPQGDAPFQKRLQPGFMPDWIGKAIENQIRPNNQNRNQNRNEGTYSGAPPYTGQPRAGNAQNSRPPQHGQGGYQGRPAQCRGNTNQNTSEESNMYDDDDITF